MTKSLPANDLRCLRFVRFVYDFGRLPNFGSAAQVKYVKTLPLHASQTIVEETPEYTVFRYHLVPTFDFRQEILSRGAAFEVLAPQWFRNEIGEEVALMCRNYGR